MSTHLADNNTTGGVRTERNSSIAVAFAIRHSNIRIREEESSGYHQERGKKAEKAVRLPRTLGYLDTAKGTGAGAP
jgi:hypothetical protein